MKSSASSSLLDLASQTVNGNEIYTPDFVQINCLNPKTKYNSLFNVLEYNLTSNICLDATIHGLFNVKYPNSNSKEEFKEICNRFLRHYIKENSSLFRHIIILDCANNFNVHQLKIKIKTILNSFCNQNKDLIDDVDIDLFTSRILSYVHIYVPSQAHSALAYLLLFRSQMALYRGDDSIYESLSYRTIVKLTNEDNDSYNPLNLLSGTSTSFAETHDDQSFCAESLHKAFPFLIIHDFDNAYKYSLIEIDQFETVGNNAYDPKSYGLEEENLAEEDEDFTELNNDESLDYEYDQIYLRHLRNRNAQSRTHIKLKNTFLKTLKTLNEQFKWNIIYLNSRNVENCSFNEPTIHNKLIKTKQMKDNIQGFINGFQQFKSFEKDVSKNDIVKYKLMISIKYRLFWNTLRLLLETLNPQFQSNISIDIIKFQDSHIYMNHLIHSCKCEELINSSPLDCIDFKNKIDSVDNKTDNVRSYFNESYIAIPR